MAATQTVHQLANPDNSAARTMGLIIPQRGVVTLFGYGITVTVDHGHLILKDGIGRIRREARLPRVGHGLRRLVVIGSDGLVSLAGLRWLSDQEAAFVLLERDGSVLTTTGPVHPSDARLRRAQSLAHQSGMAVKIARELIHRKLSGQEQLVREKFGVASIADSISHARLALAEAETIPSIRQLESQAANAYWSAWRGVPVVFPKNDLRRVPDHWRFFGSRHSPLTDSPRLAINPPNAMLNYLYAVLEVESRLALAALGLDPGIGVMHVDSPSRDSLACDLMEVIRPQVDAYLLDWILREPLHRQWFFEQRDGNCRLMGSFAVRLSETARTWGRAVAPIAEWVTRTLSSEIKKQIRSDLPPTRLTQNRRREARGNSFIFEAEHPPRPPRICRTCGGLLKRGQNHCASCAVPVSRERFIEVARHGRVASHTREAEARRGQTQSRNAAALKAWNPSHLPKWLNEKAYRIKIQPALAGITVPAIAAALGVSGPYATDIRAGRRIPHPRHWQILAQIVSFRPTESSE
jgi:CRISPR-associated endonuclease Cas1